MKKLSIENIQFIENYLDNSGIIYADIRMEMADHVASEIENRLKTNENQSFYDVFKTYMVENKPNLLDQNTKFINMVVNQNIKLILKELLSFKTGLIFIILVVLSNYIIKGFSAVLIENIFVIPLFSMVPIAIIYLIGSKKFNYSRFSAVERLGYMYGVLFHIIHLISIVIKPRIKDNLNNVIISIVFTTCMVLIYVFVKVTVNSISNYLSQYKSIA